MSVNEISGRFVTTMYNKKKYHCDSCEHFTPLKEQKDCFYKKGHCKLRDLEVFSKEWCKEQSVILQKRRSRWHFTSINECPVCGKQRKSVYHVMDRPKPENITDRMEFTMDYDHCLEE